MIVKRIWTNNENWKTHFNNEKALYLDIRETQYPL